MEELRKDNKMQEEGDLHQIALLRFCPEKVDKLMKRSLVNFVNWKFVADFEDATHGSEAHDFLVWMIIFKYSMDITTHRWFQSAPRENHNFQFLDVCW